MEKREKFSSRLGFILISAGCAIGLGNVYRFPIITGAYGGGIFVLIYLAFLLALGIPVMCCELSVGRASQRSIATSFEQLERPGQKWHWMKYLGIGGNYLLMMCYTTIAGWMLLYFLKYLCNTGIMDVPAADLGAHFGQTITSTGTVFGSTVAVILICFTICSAGLQKGVERVTKYMMLALFFLIIGLAVYSCTLPGAGEGLSFYLIPSFDRLGETDLLTVITAAMGQAFFTLSVGIGCIAIFGSYISKERTLLGEAVTITALDTLVALAAGFIIFPACFTYLGADAVDAGNAGAGFLFTTLSSIFNTMGPVLGRIIGSLFFLFLIFAAFSTVIAVFENIISFWLEKTKLSRSTICVINANLIVLLSLPAILGLSVWSELSIPGIGGILDIEDFIVSNLMLPLGSMLYVIFCTSRYGWGWKEFCTEVNTGSGLKFPRWIRLYVTFLLPLVILALMAFSIVTKFI